MSTQFPRPDVGALALDNLLGQVRHPGRYLGLELNRLCRPWDEAELRVVFAFPDLYEIGMSHQGLPLLYRIINRQAGMLADRVYAPDKDMEAELRRRRLPLFGLESRRPLSSFDIVGITFPYELCATNILSILDLGGFPLYASDRGDSDAIVVGGGSAAVNPEPVASFFDAFLIGDGEEAVVEIATQVRLSRQAALGRRSLLERLAAIDGVYVPSFFAPDYDERGRFKAIVPLVSGQSRVRRRVLAELPGVDEAPLVPLGKIVHDRLGIEIARGCTRGCRFCQAGISYRPVRERHPDVVLDIARRGLAASGFEELALLSLSTGDYSCLPQLMTALIQEMNAKNVALSMPSLRVGTLTDEMMQKIKTVKKTGFTLAPEAGTDRLRRVINKGITEPDLLEACRAAFHHGWRLMKLYFMIGLPTETDEDVLAIVDLARRCLRQAGRIPGCRLSVSVSTFIPKPHTPFQWEGQIPLAESVRRLDMLRERLRGGNIQFKWQDPRQSFLEGVFARGDRRLAGVIHAAWLDGARLDGWSEHFSLERWEKAAAGAGISLADGLRQRQLTEPLAWEHLDMGVSRDFLENERSKAYALAATADCRTQGCQHCGLCDFKSLRPVLWRPKPEVAEMPAFFQEKIMPSADAPRTMLRFHYERRGDIRFLSHLELIQTMYRALCRSGMPLIFSRGFSPIPRVSFSPALPVGTESLAEYIDVLIHGAAGDHDAFLKQLSATLPSGLALLALEVSPSPMPEAMIVSYLCRGLPGSDAGIAAAVGRFRRPEPFFLTLERKGRVRHIELKSVVVACAAAAPGELLLEMYFEQSRAGIKPLEALMALFDVSAADFPALRICKTGWRQTSLMVTAGEIQ